MKTLRLINHIKGVLGLLVLTLWSCQDDWETNRVPEGKPATISVRIDLGKMAQLTRADMDSRLENRVNNLWVGVYNVATGLRTGQVFVDDVQREDLDYPEKDNVFGKIENLSAKSGESYIVAVANYLNAKGFTVENDGGIVPQDLERLLRDAETWDKYRAIALSRNYNTDNNYAIIDAPTNSVENGLVMQGSYRKGGHADNHTDDNPETINIAPGTNPLSGEIHLRRLWSQNTVNFMAEGNVISLEIIEMEVVNVPQYSWLQSRDQGPNADKDHRLEYANAGDALHSIVEDPEKHPNYLKSLKVTQPSMDMTTNAEDGITTYSYSFWQYENKRTGSITEDVYVTEDAAYAKREKESKKEDNSNSGIYTALCPNGNSLNNNATYIRFKAVITYKGTGNLKPDEIIDDAAAFDGITQRTAEATYVVHLGYIDKDVNDFNCYRNAKYTYNIKVQSVNKILVEAWNEGESQPGAEGEVNDVTEKFYDLDCHYNVFNIYLTRADLQNFTFTMRTYDNNEAHDIKYLKQGGVEIGNTVPDSKEAPNWKYYSWIQLVPNDNTDANATTIALFPELNADGDPKNGALYYLKDIAELGDKLVDEGKDGRGFTVYIKEYTYEADYGEKDYGNEASGLWKRYVNQPNRTAHFNVSFKESSDKESIYYKSKYALTQKSIQTYYDVTQGTEAGKDLTALGIEHDNEVFGMNIRWPKEITGLSADNGRYNMYLGYGGAALKEDVLWSNVLDLNNLQSINKIDNDAQTRLAPHISKAERTCPVPKTVEISAADLSGGSEGKYNTIASLLYDPQSGGKVQYIHALNACMNRNKDENGNGIIDNAELKWYVPASGKYLRMILGRNTLKTPLMNYEQAKLPKGCSDGYNTLYHFMASDNKIIWVDEGASSCKFYGARDDEYWIFAPWQVRCIRNLGTNLNTITNAERVLPAYDATDINTVTHGGVVKVTRYHGSALRQPQIDPLPMHKSDGAYNRIARYGFEIAPMGNRLAKVETYEEEKTSAVLGSNVIDNTTYQDYAAAVKNGNFCKSLNAKSKSNRKGWRLPNQKEIVIMLRMKGIFNNGSSQQTYATCTQEHWTNYDNPGSSSEPLNSWNYRLLTVDASENEKVAVALNKGKTIDYIRCVRDLTAAEAGMSYSDIVANLNE